MFKKIGLIKPEGLIRVLWNSIERIPAESFPGQQKTFEKVFCQKALMEDKNGNW